MGSSTSPSRHRTHTLGLAARGRNEQRWNTDELADPPGATIIAWQVNDPAGRCDLAILETQARATQNGDTTTAATTRRVESGGRRG
jgi:hypothetical protein